MSSLARRITLLTAATTLLLAPSAFAARGFSLGVAAGDVTADSAILWGKANRSGDYRLQLSERRGFRQLAVERLVRARARNDNTVQAALERLDAGTRYF